MDDSDDEYVGTVSPSNESGASLDIANRTRHKTGDPKLRINESLKGASGGYAWEDEIQRSWDIVQEDKAGSLETIVNGLTELRKKRFLKNVTPFQRGIIRTLVLVIDFSSVMLEKDLRPNRSTLTVNYAIDFVTEYFDQNPISQLGVVIMRNGLAQLVSDVSGNPHDHIELLKNLRKVEPQGDPTLQNALEMARGLLLHVPSHATREVLVIFGALLTSDPGDIHKTINSLVKEKIRCKVIGLTAQVAICKELCKRTNFGDDTSYGVILNEVHYKDLLMDAVTPVLITKSTSSSGFSLVKMGFLSRISEESPTFCSCHSKLIYGGFICPQCHSKVCSLPMVCPCCNLMLILSTHLARSYHHLFPLKLFPELTKEFKSKNCFSCQHEFPPIDPHVKDFPTSRYRCPECKNDFCIDCDVFVHETLHNCPGCLHQT